MIKVRKSVFETNSSSCHTLTLGRKSDFDKLKSKDYVYTECIEYESNGMTFFHELNGSSIIPIEKVIDDIRKFLNKLFFSDHESLFKQIKENFKNLEKKQVTNKVWYDFIIDSLWFFNEYVFKDYQITNTEYVLALRDDEKNAQKYDSWLENEFEQKVEKDEDKLLIRDVMVKC
jgi:hypothetical protein